MHVKVYPKAVGSQAYVHFLTFVADNAVNERGIYTCFMVFYTLLTHLPSALEHTLHCLSAHCIVRESSLGMGMGVT